MRDKVNLLVETTELMAEHGKSPSDVRFVVGAPALDITNKYGRHEDQRPQRGTWDDFARVAGVTIYDPGYGLEEIDTSLMIVGDDWWMERHEYDGSEWWEFKSRPIDPTTSVPLVALRYSR